MDETEKLTDTVNHFCRWITALPADMLVEQDWGPREVLAHIVYYHELFVNLVEARLSKKEFPPPEGSFRELNAAAVSASRGISPSILVDRLKKANARLVELYQRHNPEDIILEIKAGAKPRRLAELVPEVEAHIRNHLKKLQKVTR
ncbi:MAG: hypothetical protein AB1345_02640 [Chloroflexota bacterium]